MQGRSWKESRGKAQQERKKIMNKIKRTDKKIARINKKMQNSRQGDAEDDDDKLCKPCCDETPTPAPPPGPTTSPPGPTTTPPPPLPPNNCTNCVKWTATVLDVWRFQETNFDR